MLCSKYEKLNALERVEMVGSICHAMQTDNAIFKNVQDLIALAKRKGLFDNVTINPVPIEPPHDPEISSIS